MGVAVKVGKEEDSAVLQSRKQSDKLDLSDTVVLAEGKITYSSHRANFRAEGC
jgi:hypothetical protein